MKQWTRRALLPISAATASLAFGIAAAHAAAPYEGTYPVNGTLTFEDSTGAPVTSGSTDATPFATYAISNTVQRAGDTKAILALCTPQEGVDPSKWPCDTLNAATTYPVASGPADVRASAYPVSTVRSNDLTLQNIIDENPNTATDSYANYYQLRLITSGGPSAGVSATYAVADVLDNPSAHTFSITTPTATQASLVVSPAGTQTAGTQETLTATVTPGVAGQVQFKDGARLLGSAVTVAGGSASESVTLDPGSHSLTAFFMPTSFAGYAGTTSPAQTYSVNPAPALPEAPFAIGLPLVAVAAGGTTVALRRRRSSRRSS